MKDTFVVHHTVEANADRSVPDPHQDRYSMAVFGFWIYLLTDCLLFTTLFLTYAVLHVNTFGGPGPKEIYHIPTAFYETMLLLFSSLTCGLALLSAAKSKRKETLIWLGVTFLLGASFIALELHEFYGLIKEGHSFRVSAFLSSFFTLVGTHGAHVTTGLLWLLVMVVQVLMQGINVDTFRRLVLFNLFWHFLDLIWIFIFTFVYLMGAIS